ncbi:hypothetical protein Nepgr_029227 [Nepenthes gracilis]|uniref:Uncharacterized protein n=1 Tax=Nepenthes gracilis TaxID=150966 RepID=A0AAD3TDP3_NEPGR|nr:hypothetical protein Nepgr_029227 [Nepenthes gracilis]
MRRFPPPPWRYSRCCHPNPWSHGLLHPRFHQLQARTLTLFSLSIACCLFVSLLSLPLFSRGPPSLLLLLPLPSASGFCLARFFRKKSLSSYFVFVVLGSLMVMWFVMHNFWDLSLWLAGVSLKSLCKLIVASIVLAVAIPGLALFPPKFQFLTKVALIGHALPMFSHAGDHIKVCGMGLGSSTFSHFSTTAALQVFSVSHLLFLLLNLSGFAVKLFLKLFNGGMIILAWTNYIY